MKIAVFTGAGISKESGIPTFRDASDGIYNDATIAELVTVEALKERPEELFHWHNVLRDKYRMCRPNEAHLFLTELESKYDVTIVTQNVDN